MSQKEIKSTSLNQKAWRRLKRNKSAMFGLAIIVFSVALALLAYVVSPDNSPSGNEQILQLETHPPGFSIQILKKPKATYTPSGVFQGIANGFVTDYEPIPVVNYRVEGNTLFYTEYRGRVFKAEERKVALAEFTEGRDVKVEDLVEKRTFWLGTDKFGRDILSRLIIGVRVSLSVGLVSVLISLVIGIVLGALAGYFYGSSPAMGVLDILALLFVYIPVGVVLFVVILMTILNPGPKLLLAVLPYSWWLLVGVVLNVLGKYVIKWKAKFPVDDIIMWMINVFWSIPTLLLAMGLYVSAVNFFDDKLTLIFVAVGITMWVETARIVRGQFMGIKELEFVNAARSLGYSDARIIFMHILPNIMGPVIVVACANFANAILVESGLSYIGLGIQPPAPSWGSMLNEYKDFIDTNKAYLALFPGAAIMLLVLAFNLVGNGLRDALDVKGQLD